MSDDRLQVCSTRRIGSKEFRAATRIFDARHARSAIDFISADDEHMSTGSGERVAERAAECACATDDDSGQTVEAEERLEIFRGCSLAHGVPYD